MENIKNTFIILLALYSAFFWLGALAVPFLSHFGIYDLSAKLSFILSNACHQNPERSFWFLGYPVSLCARCLGVYLSVTFTCILALAGKLKINGKLFVSLALICSADILLNIFHVNTFNITRFCIGLIIGLLITVGINYILRRKRYEN